MYDVYDRYTQNSNRVSRKRSFSNSLNWNKILELNFHCFFFATFLEGGKVIPFIEHVVQDHIQTGL